MLKGYDICHVDFESRSACNLKETGVDIYSKHPTTDILCMAYAINDEPVELWIKGDPFPERIQKLINKPTTIFKAHNANFELNLWNNCAVPKLNWPRLPLDRLECTMAQAYSMGLPGSLENASLACGLTKQKDMPGHRIMLQLSQPRELKPYGKIVWWEPESAKDEKDKAAILEKFAHLYRYCKTDVEVERELDKRLLRLSENERSLWRLDQKINSRGIKVDIKALTYAKQVADFEKKKLNADIKYLTEGVVATCNAVEQIKNFLTDYGVAVESIGKSEVSNLLEDPSLPKICKDVLELRRLAAKSSTAKIDKMILGANIEDDRVRGNFQFAGAGTGRWAARRIQLQNLPRQKLPPSEIENIFKILHKNKDNYELSREEIDMLHGAPLNCLSECIRGFLVPEKSKQFLICDYNAIEARVVAWLAGEERMLKIFRDGNDPYLHAASGIYGRPITKADEHERAVGKVSILALGYQGGKDAFQRMAKSMGVKVSDTQAEQIKTLWRKNNPFIVRYWEALEKAALNAVRFPGKLFKAGAASREVTFKKAGSFLLCRLPSGRLMIYAYPSIQQKETPWGEMRDAVAYKAEDSLTREWKDHFSYSGLLCENVTQAVARDLLAEAMVKLDKAGFTITIHVHDEIVCEEKIGSETHTLEKMKQIMCDNPSWAKDLPLKTGGSVSSRYHK